MMRTTSVSLAIGLVAVMTVSVSGLPKKTPGEEHRKPRLDIKPNKIKCRSKEYDGLRGTLYVPEDRTRPDSRMIELPFVVVKSISPNPDYPIFQFTGGPGISNIAPEERVSEASLKDHDVVEVGYRGIDGPVKLTHPHFNEIFRTPNILSPSSLKQIGQKLTQAAKDLTAAGMDVEEYNILNVVDDMDAAREALDYEKINITGGSYGGAVVMVYCLRYPERINRAIMLEAAFPYDIAFGKPEEFDTRLNHLNELWKKNAESVKRTPDIVKTMRNVLARMPEEYNGIPIELSKVRFMTYFGITNQRSYANMVLDAYVSAEKGDFSSIAAMCLMYDQFMSFAIYPGDLLAKTFSSVTDPDRDFVSELSDPGSVIGSPLSMVAWGSFEYSDWPVKPVAKEHPPTQKSNVETLIFYGSKETGEPFRKKYEENFTNAHWLILDDLGHMDIWNIIGEGTNHLMLRFLNDGVVDTSKIGRIPEWDFTPQATFNQMLQQMMQQPK